MIAFLTVIGGILLTLVGALFTNEVKSWLPRLALWIGSHAAARLKDPEMRLRYDEEWQATLRDIPGPLIAVAHAVTLFASVRSTERASCAETTPQDIEARFAALGATLRSKFGYEIREARVAHGLSVAVLSKRTGISEETLRTLEQWDLVEIQRLGPKLLDCLAILSRYLSGLGDLDAEYRSLFPVSGGLPPAPLPTWHQRAARWRCIFQGHLVFETVLHSQYRSSIHFRHKRCFRCGGVSVMWSEGCAGSRLEEFTDGTSRIVCDAETLYHGRRTISLDPQDELMHRLRESTKYRHTSASNRNS